MTESKTVYERFLDVQDDLKAIEKTDRNTQQGFQFRGIDAVMMAVGPLLRKHRIFILPKPVSLESETYQTSKGTSMRNVTVHMEYTVRDGTGDSFSGGAYGEAADAGDKAVSKAQSVAYRTFLLQGTTAPTGDADPDASTHERAADVQDDPDFTAARNELAAKAKALGFTREGMEDKCIEAVGLPITAVKIRSFIKTLAAEPAVAS